jgi:hypothetical protein
MIGQPARRSTRAVADDLKTVDDAIGELNRRYSWTLPRRDDFPAGSPLHDIWSLDIDVVPQPPAPLLFKGCSKDKAYAFAFDLTGQLVIYVTSGPDSPVTPCA